MLLLATITMMWMVGTPVHAQGAGEEIIVSPSPPNFDWGTDTGLSDNLTTTFDIALMNAWTSSLYVLLVGDCVGEPVGGYVDIVPFYIRLGPGESTVSSVMVRSADPGVGRSSESHIAIGVFWGPEDDPGMHINKTHIGSHLLTYTLTDMYASKDNPRTSGWSLPYLDLKYMPGVVLSFQFSFFIALLLTTYNRRRKTKDLPASPPVECYPVRSSR
jgi:hypothetical protein